MRLNVEFESVIGVGEVLFGLLFYFRVCRNPVQKFGAVARVFGKSGIISLKGFVGSKFFCSERLLCKVIAADESSGIQHIATNRSRNQPFYQG